MKVAISGKGGVGKTTLTALLAQQFAEDGRAVLAIDADPAPCLAEALGLPAAKRGALQPIGRMADLIEERTGARPGASGGFFTLNPRVDDIPEKYSAVHRGVRLLELGSMETGGSGCICPESALLKALVNHLLFREQDVLLLDMYAGVEHLGRATVDFVDALLIVVEPTHRSLGTAKQIKKLASDIGLKRCWLVGNKIAVPEDMAFLEANRDGMQLLQGLPLDNAVLQADRRGEPAFDASPRLREEARRLTVLLDNLLLPAPA